MYDGAIWFVAKRLADTVRKHIQEHHPDKSIPGGNKNDRLFDTWQDYGLIEPNPSSGGAIWKVIVQGLDYELPPFPVLKFPLHRLFDAPNQYPVDMQGSITVLTGDKADAVQVEIDAEETAAVSKAASVTDASIAEGSAAVEATVAARTVPDGLLDASDAIAADKPKGASPTAPATNRAANTSEPNRGTSGSDANGRASTPPAPKPAPSIDRNAFSIPGPKPVSKQGTTGGNSKTLYNPAQGANKGAEPKPENRPNTVPAPLGTEPKAQPIPASNVAPKPAPVPVQAQLPASEAPAKPATQSATAAELAPFELEFAAKPKQT